MTSRWHRAELSEQFKGVQKKRKTQNACCQLPSHALQLTEIMAIMVEKTKDDGMQVEQSTLMLCRQSMNIVGSCLGDKYISKHQHTSLVLVSIESLTSFKS